MEKIIQFLPLLLSIEIYIILVIFLEFIARAGMGQAFWFKKNKSRTKKENAKRPRIYKIFGLYDFSMPTHAPHHLRKYAVIRICNLASLLITPTVYLCIPYVPELKIVFHIFVALHILFLFGPILADTLLLSNMKKYGKLMDFDKSSKP